MQEWILLVRRELSFYFLKKDVFFNILSLFLIVIFMLSLLVNPNHSSVAAILILITSLIICSMFAHYVFQDDYQDTSLDHLKVSGYSSTFISTAKLLSYWILNISVVTIGTFIYLLMYRVHISDFTTPFLILLISSLVITSISTLSASLTLATSRSNLLNMLISAPISLSFLIYTSKLLKSVNPMSLSEISILLGFCFIIMPISIFTCSYSISEIQCKS